MRTFDVVIIGAGTSGLTARREVAKKTENYIVIDDGPLGTTCARVGCMPSKVLIQVANDFKRREKFEMVGIHGASHLELNTKEVMNHVRSLRDRFVKSVKNPMADWEEKLIRGRAQFVDEHTLEVNGETIKADKIIVATGSSPLIPKPWQEFKEQLVTTDQFFEMEDLPKTMAVIGLGVIGSELGLALARLGVKVLGVTVGKSVGGLSDPALQDYVANYLNEEIDMNFHGADIKGINLKGELIIAVFDENRNVVKEVAVEKALISVGRVPQISKLKLDVLGFTKDDRGKPIVDPNTLKLRPYDHIFMPGDVNADRPILHEAADEGMIAGHNAVNEQACFKRRESLGITFTEPNIAFVGKRYKELTENSEEFVTGKVSFEGQGRSIVKLKEKGLLHVYAAKNTGVILGAEIFAPQGEHLAHLLAWAISTQLTVMEALKMPFYHPVIEEGLRTALRSAAQQVSIPAERELFRCEDPPIR